MLTLEWRNVKPPGGSISISTSITEREAGELARLALGADALEIGAAYGYSSVIIGQAATHLHSVDPHVWLDSLSQWHSNIAHFGLQDKVTPLAESSNVALPAMLAQGMSFDFVFIDGDHGAEQVGRDIGMALTLLRDGGTLALHDLDEVTCPGVRQAVEIWRMPDYVLDTLAVYTDVSKG